MKKEKITSWLLPLITFGCIIAIWSASAFAVDSQYVLPSVSLTLEALGELLVDKSFYIAFALTFLRVIIAFIVSFVLAFVFAHLVKKYAVLEKVINPVVSVIRSLPTIAVVLLLLCWTNSQIAPVVVTMLVVLPTLYTNLCSAFDGVDKEVVEMCYLFNVDKKKIYKSVKVPATLPSILVSIGSGIALNLKLMVAAEVLAATANSLGGKLSFANYNLQVATMFALVVVTIITGVVIESIFSYASKKVGEWK